MSTSSRKRTTTKKKNSSSKKGRAGKKTEDFSSFHTEVAIWITVAFAALLLLGNFGFCGQFGKVFSSIFFGTFGLIQYILPVVIILLMGLLMANQFSTLAVKKAILVIVLLCMCSTISQMVVDFDVNSAFLAAGYSFSHHTGGGAVGGGICIFLHKLFGKAGAILIVGLISMISLMLIFEKSVLKLLKEAGISTAEASRQRKIRREEIRREREEEFAREQIRKEELSHTLNARKKKNRMEEKNVFPDTLLEEREENVLPKKKKKKLVDLGKKFGLDTAFEEFGSEYQENQIPQGKVSNILQEEKEEEFIMPPVTGLSDSMTELTAPETDCMSEVMMPERDFMPEVQEKPKTIHTRPALDKDVDKQVQEDIAEAAATEEKAYVFPPMELLAKGDHGNSAKQQKSLKETARKLQQTLANFGVNVTITNVSCGPSVTRYELQPEQGVKVSRILNLADDIKLNLAAADIRIEAPIPGKAAIGIEVPNKHNVVVRFRDLIDNEVFHKFSSNLAFAVGKDIGGNVVLSDITKMPHLLIAGATGSGKSVCINTLIMSILYKANPNDVKFIMIDPKVVELSTYNGIPHLLIPVVTDPQKAAGALNWAVAEMTERYQKFAEYNVRNLQGYNKKVEEVWKTGEVSEEELKKLPQIVIIVDELADLMMVAPGEVEGAIVRLSQLARAAGIHLVIATQRPSVNVITGLIKANVPSRIAFAVSSGVDSRTIIDMNGAEKLLGRGDMLFYPQGQQKPIRVQGAFISDQEVGAVVDFLKKQRGEEEISNEISDQVNQKIENTIRQSLVSDDRDEYFEEAAKFIITKEKASIGMIQRMFKVGFNRASRIMEQLADAGVVGPEEGTKPRKILMSEEQLSQYLEEYM